MMGECVGREGRKGGEWDLEMNVRMAYRSYEVDIWRGVWVGRGDLDVEFPETGCVGQGVSSFSGFGLVF